MDKKQVYNKYFEEHDLRDLVELETTYTDTELFHEIYRAKDTNISLCKTSIACEEVSTPMVIDGEEVQYAKVSFSDIPYSANIIDVYIYSKELKYDTMVYVLDLSDCDMSDVISFNVTIMAEQELHIIFPDLDSKRAGFIATQGLFENSRDEWIKKELPKIDTSNLIDAKRMFFRSGLVDFNFDMYDFHSLRSMQFMFGDCVSLIEVKGSLNCCKQIWTQSMFSGSSNIRHIQENIFGDSELMDAKSMFSLCKSLENVPILENNVSGVHWLELGYIFCCCNSMNSLDITGVMVSAFYKNTGWSAHWESALLWYSNDIKFCKCQLQLSKNMAGVFAEVKSEVVDIRHLTALSNKHGIGIMDLFLNCSELVFDAFDAYAAINYLIDNNKMSLDGIVHDYLHPKVVVVNDSMPLNLIDRHIFKVVDMKGTQDYEVDTKISLIKMMGDNSTKILDNYKRGR